MQELSENFGFFGLLSGAIWEQGVGGSKPLAPIFGRIAAKNRAGEEWNRRTGEGEEKGRVRAQLGRRSIIGHASGSSAGRPIHRSTRRIRRSAPGAIRTSLSAPERDTTGRPCPSTL